MSEERIGQVGHVWKKAGSASIELVDTTLRLGDRIRIRGGGRDFEQLVDSMEVDHVASDLGGPGELVAIGVQGPVAERDEVWRIRRG
jgi:hypothetical protein